MQGCAARASAGFSAPQGGPDKSITSPERWHWRATLRSRRWGHSACWRDRTGFTIGGREIARRDTSLRVGANALKTSLPGLIRQSIFFERTSCEDGWMPGSSPGMTSVFACTAISSVPPASTASRPNVRDDGQRPSEGQDGGGYRFDLGQRRSEIFLQIGLDRPNQLDPLQEISFLAQRRASRKTALIHRAARRSRVTPALGIRGRLRRQPRRFGGRGRRAWTAFVALPGLIGK